MKHSIRIKLAVVLTLLVSGAIIICLLVNSIFLKKHYTKVRQNDLRRAYKAVEKILDDRSETIDDTTKRKITAICERLSVSLLIVDPSMEKLYVYGDNGNNLNVILKHMIFNNDEVASKYYFVISDVESTDNYIIKKIHDNIVERDYYDMYGIFSENHFFLMRITIENVDALVKDVNSFFGLVSTVVIIGCVIIVSGLSYWITYRLLKLVKISDKMSHMDFDTKYDFYGNRHDEIDMLGESMNRLSDELQKNISELKSANMELMKDVDEKTKIDNARREFLSNVSHELKTPLAIIQGYAEGLKESVNDDESSREYYCDVIIDEAQKMNTLVKRLLTLNQVENGYGNLNVERFNIVEVIEQRLNAISKILEQKDIKVIFLKNQSINVWADEFMVEEVLTNYLSNAINHIDGDRVIKITLEKFERNINDTAEHKVRITVYNTGKPIPDIDIDNIWDKFYKVDKARTREYGGNGIGLSIVKAIMDAHNQKCGVMNISNGVAFWFELDADES